MCTFEQFFNYTALIKFCKGGKFKHITNIIYGLDKKNYN